MSIEDHVSFNYSQTCL